MQKGTQGNWRRLQVEKYKQENNLMLLEVNG